ncbi:MAG: formate--phosphoribosylaminoimidazolecarboxamide ligase [Patescibacteria group bacterium]|nr:formate--phosphoribosylaminoimidazolecarboxamide ligase [Patescibacteria group bacterium]
MKQADYTIAVLGSHSALQILKGAKDEGFRTLVICLPGKDKIYRMFKVADEVKIVKSYQDLSKLPGSILIPHASLISYLGVKAVEKLPVKYFGNRKILAWEADRVKSRQWLDQAKLRQPKIFASTEKIDRPVIVKFFGAGGGKDYFMAQSRDDYEQKIKVFPKQAHLIQEYIVGVPVYAHYFYSNLSHKIELMGFDKRYESNADGLGRMAIKDQAQMKNLSASYLICGNLPLVIRESLLPEYMAMGERTVKAAQSVVKDGLWGPFCLETVITDKGEIYVFEVSARIVAGTNLYINGSPYTDLYYNEPMSTGRRIAREVKVAIETKQLRKILC